jgi:hypothetical protein
VNRYTTKKGQQVGYGNHGINDEGILMYKELRSDLSEASRSDYIGILREWDNWTETNDVDIEWKRKRKVMTAWNCVLGTVLWSRKFKNTLFELFSPQVPVEEDKREHDGEVFVLPGERGHKGSTGWANVEEGLDEGEGLDGEDDDGVSGYESSTNRRKSRGVTVSPHVTNRQVAEELDDDFPNATDDDYDDENNDDEDNNSTGGIGFK